MFERIKSFFRSAWDGEEEDSSKTLVLPLLIDGERVGYLHINSYVEERIADEFNSKMLINLINDMMDLAKTDKMQFELFN